LLPKGTLIISKLLLAELPMRHLFVPVFAKTIVAGLPAVLLIPILAPLPAK
jgi:hypothetical protein